MPDGFQTTPSVAAEALAGLTSAHKTLPAKLFYDDEGCRLFGEITRLPEYYVTRTEQALLATVAPQIAAPAGVVLVEYGASDESKAALLLAHLNARAYVPIDVAEGALDALAQRMAGSHPGLDVFPIAGDFKAGAATGAGCRAAVARVFPGSTIGNFEPKAATAFLQRARGTLGAGSSFVVGVDLRKDRTILEPAYDDAQGVTAAFNLNLLTRLNREAAADFDIGGFRHRAVWNEQEGRIEMHLESLRTQTVRVGGIAIGFVEGETIHTESSYKHTVAGFQAIATAAGWSPAKVWQDEAGLFSIHLLRG